MRADHFGALRASRLDDTGQTTDEILLSGVELALGPFAER
jgi:hypothetical protein